MEVHGSCGRRWMRIGLVSYRSMRLTRMLQHFWGPLPSLCGQHVGLWRGHGKLTFAPVVLTEWGSSNSSRVAGNSDLMAMLVLHLISYVPTRLLPVCHARNLGFWICGLTPRT